MINRIPIPSFPQIVYRYESGVLLRDIHNEQGSHECQQITETANYIQLSYYFVDLVALLTNSFLVVVIMVVLSTCDNLDCLFQDVSFSI